jgi:DNA-binding beta-propeller fold protein YncE
MKRYTSVEGVISRAVLVVVALIAASTSAFAQGPAAQPAGCNRPFPDPVTVIKLPGQIAGMAPTRDGCWVFVGFVQRQDLSGGSGVGVLRRTGDTVEEVRAVPVPGNPTGAFGLALTHDQKVLVASHARQVSFFDVEKLTTGQGEPLLGQVSGSRIGYSFGVTITPDDRYAFVAQGALASVVVIDLAKGRTTGFDSAALVGLVPGVFRPSMTALSPDGKFLYVTNKQPPDVISPSPTCLGGKQPEGVVQIVDAHRATSEGVSATIGFASAGCEPNALTLSPDGARLSVVAPGVPDILSPQASPADSALVIFDVRDGKTATRIGKVPLPKIPVSVVDTGNRIVVGLIGGGNLPAELAIIDPSKVAYGTDAIIGRIPETAPGVMLGPDGHTVFGNAGRQNPRGPGLLVVDLERARVQPTTSQPVAK